MRHNTMSRRVFGVTCIAVAVLAAVVALAVGTQVALLVGVVVAPPFLFAGMLTLLDVW